MSDLPETVSARELAPLLGITANRLTVLAKDGVIPKQGRAAYPLKDAVRAYVEFTRENPGGRKRESSEAKERLTLAQAERAEVALARDRGELLSADEVRAEWLSVVADLKARLLALPNRVAARTALDVTATAALDAELRAALSDLADAGATEPDIEELLS
jgi:phage terminase Nu1 subunit (DNA packaging protein)